MKLIDVEPIIKNLSAMKTQLGYDAIKIDRMIKALRKAEEVTAAQQPNVPLTLDELQEMDGEPVWGAFSEGSGRYMIIQWHNSEFFKTFECGFLLLEEYGKTWMAYRRKPEEASTCQKTSSLSG